jgi:hypothetical protein
MRKHLALLAALFVFIPGCSLPGLLNLQGKSGGKIAPADAEEAAKASEVMKELRNRVLTTAPQELGLTEADAKAKVWAVLMEMPRPGGVATLLSIRDGTASLYTTTGGGILGGYSAQKEAQEFVIEAEKHLARMKPTESFPYPETGRIRFYLRTPDGVYTVEADEKQLTSGRHHLMPLFLAGNNVLTKLREAYERSGSERGQ